jgi:hypothetical protein
VHDDLPCMDDDDLRRGVHGAPRVRRADRDGSGLPDGSARRLRVARRGGWNSRPPRPATSLARCSPPRGGWHDRRAGAGSRAAGRPDLERSCGSTG